MNRRAGGQADGRAGRRTDGWTGGRAGRRTGGQAGGRTEGWTDAAVWHKVIMAEAGTKN